MKIAYLITTYNRSEACQRLVDSIYGNGDIFIINDGSKGYRWVKDYDVCYYKNKKNLGKQGFHKTVTNLWQMAGFDYEFYFSIQDDFLPVENFQMRAIKTWMQIPDHRKMCLNILVDKSRLNKTIWTDFPAIEYPNFRRTGWVDMHFMADSSFFEFFGCRIPETREVWEDKTLSSGVGRYISRKLYKAGYTMYQTKTSLLVPQPEAFQSQMNNWRTDQKINEVIL